MSEHGEVRKRRVRWVASIVAAAGLVVVGGLSGAALTERRHARVVSPPPSGPVAGESPAASPAGGHAGHGTSTAATTSEEPVEVTLTPDAMARAGIKTTAVIVRESRATLSVPGTVGSNAYHDTKVNALVGGVVRQVGAELGAGVRRGQALAVVFSSELADAQMKYLSMQAMRHADDQRLARTRKLLDIGAVSRQDLDDATAVQAARATEVAAARQRLLVLGLSAEQVGRLTDASQIVSEISIVAPTDGVVIARAVNTGQVVAPGQDLFVVTDLTTLWIIGDLYERDFAAVRVGTPASVVIPAAPARPIPGRVAYIDPRVDPATRTAKVRVEIPNRDGALRLGMFVDVRFETGVGGPRVLVPRAAVQPIGSRSVVYVATEDEGRFAERVVRLGAAVGELVEVIDGVKAGERIVADGSFYLRAEAGRARAGG